jgi:hypothetical protein
LLVSLGQFFYNTFEDGLIFSIPELVLEEMNVIPRIIHSGVHVFELDLHGCELAIHFTQSYLKIFVSLLSLLVEFFTLSLNCLICILLQSLQSLIGSLNDKFFSSSNVFWVILVGISHLFLKSGLLSSSFIS